MMTPKLLVPFILLAILPIGMLAWMGQRIVKSEEAELERNLEHVYRGKLRDHDATIRKVLDSRRRILLKIADSMPEPFGVKELRTRTRQQSAIRQLFLLDDRSQLRFPSPDQPLSTAETEFLKRTGGLWRGKLIPASSGKNGDVPVHPYDPPNHMAATDGIEQNTSQSLEVTANQAKVFSVTPGAETASDQGWLTWFWENGVNVMYWTRLNNGCVLGAEFDRAALLADVIAELPTTDPFQGELQDERVSLRDATGKVVYQWGDFAPTKDAKPKASLTVSAPLSAWSLDYYPGPQAIAPGLGRSTAFTMTVTLAALGLAFLTLAIFFFLEHTRAMREAATRVSFVNRVSHELKTPLTNIRMYAELLAAQMEDVDDKAMERLAVITGEAERLSRLISNVLTFSRSERKKLSLHKSSGCVDTVVEHVLERFQPSFDRAGIRAVTNLAVPDAVRLDSDALEQILTNLLSNVEKYAAVGQRVDVATKAYEDKVTISVSDNGPGIPRTQADQVFKPFTRLDDSLNEGISGTGIGLGIARELARLHGGELRLEPCESGACFVVTLNVGDE